MDFTHGNYCGWTWSNGEYQPSVCGDKPSVDAFDSTCKEHDCCLYKAGDDYSEQSHCNDAFFSQNFGHGKIRSAAAIAVSSFQQPFRKVTDMFRYTSNPRMKAKEFARSGHLDRWDLDAKGPFNMQYTGNVWEYEDIKGGVRCGMESRYDRPSNQKRKRVGMTGERSVKRKTVIKDLGKSKAQRTLFRDPVVQRRRAFAQLPREWRVAHANYQRAKWRLRRGRQRRARIQKARTLKGMFARGRASNRIKRWWRYQKRRWRHYPKDALVHANWDRLDRYNNRRRVYKRLGRYRRPYLRSYKW